MLINIFLFSFLASYLLCSSYYIFKCNCSHKKFSSKNAIKMSIYVLIMSPILLYIKLYNYLYKTCYCVKLEICYEPHNPESFFRMREV